mmetsp:Transcript_20276/g.54060  ORF Transcript_20276/g.54060 Transcript_20276/m.54060 type:complete len:215 (-) Transcript_20276:99-743(-)
MPNPRALPQRHRVAQRKLPPPLSILRGELLQALRADAAVPGAGADAADVPDVRELALDVDREEIRGGGVGDEHGHGDVLAVFVRVDVRADRGRVGPRGVGVEREVLCVEEGRLGEDEVEASAAGEDGAGAEVGEGGGGVLVVVVAFLRRDAPHRRGQPRVVPRHGVRKRGPRAGAVGQRGARDTHVVVDHEDGVDARAVRNRVEAGVEGVACLA